MSRPSPSSSRASLPLPATTSASSASLSGGAAGGLGGGNGPTVRVLSSQEDLASRPRSASRGSISVGMGRAGSRDSLSLGAGGRREGATTPVQQGGGAGSTIAAATGAGLARSTTPTSPISALSDRRPSSSTVSGILPSSVFLNPRLPTTTGPTSPSPSQSFSQLPSSPTMSDAFYSLARPLSAASTVSSIPGIPLSLSPPTSPRSGIGARQQGPIITRVSSAMSPAPSPIPPSPSASSANEFASPPVPPSSFTFRRPLSPLSLDGRRTSVDDFSSVPAPPLSPEEVAEDLAAGGRLAQQRRSSLDLANSAVLNERAVSPIGGGGSFVVPVQREREERPAEQASEEEVQHFVAGTLPLPVLQQQQQHHQPPAPAPASPPTPRAFHPSAAGIESEKPFSALPARPSSPSPSPGKPSATPQPPLVPTHNPSPQLRNYLLHPGRNRFFLHGRLLSSGDNPLPFILSMGIAILLPGLFWAFNGEFLWRNLGAGGGGKASLFIFGYLVLVMWSSMLKTALSDPGILPRNLDPHPTRKLVSVEGSAEGGRAGEGAVWRAQAKYVRVRGEGVVASKWCETCHTYRPPRTSHCRLCDNCVEHTDHHCAFLNNCIGRRTYLPFLSFLLSSSLSGAYSIAFSVWHVYRSSQLYPSSSTSSPPWTEHWDAVGAIVVAILTFGVWIPVVGLAGYHARLVWTNRTTVEMLRPPLDRHSTSFSPSTGAPLPGNVWALSSPWANCVGGWCAPGVATGGGGYVEWRGQVSAGDGRGEGEGGKEGV